MPARVAMSCVTCSALLLAACGQTSPSVTGNVTFKGQPLPSGTVLFHAADGTSTHALITDGRYAIADAPLGPVRIAVKSHAAMPTRLPSRGGPAPAAPKDAAPPPAEKRDGKSVAIPPRYADAASSGLTYAVRSGRQTHDIELTP